MNAEKLKEITTAASEAVKDLDPSLKKGAFETILNKLLETNIATASPQNVKKKTKARTKTKPAASPKQTTKGDDITKTLLTKINRTDHPCLSKMTKIGDKALYVLKMALDNNVDGLVPSQIAYILNEKFRQKGTQNAVSMALMKSDYVDRRPITVQGGSGYTYHLMEPGENYLKNIIKQLDAGEKKGVNS